MASRSILASMGRYKDLYIYDIIKICSTICCNTPGELILLMMVDLRYSVNDIQQKAGMMSLFSEEMCASI